MSSNVCEVGCLMFQSFKQLMDVFKTKFNPVFKTINGCSKILLVSGYFLSIWKLSICLGNSLFPNVRDHSMGLMEQHMKKEIWILFSVSKLWWCLMDADRVQKDDV